MAKPEKQQIQNAVPLSASKPGTGAIIFFAALFLLGAAHWVAFFHAGDMKFTANDWPKEHKYYSILREAVQKFKLPFYYEVAKSHPSLGVFLPEGEYKFLSVPETPASPQMLLLGVMEAGTYVVFNMILMYALGFWGLLLIRKKFGMSWPSFAGMFLLFNFNGHVVTHLSCGHSMWWGYFLMPFYVLFTFELFDGSTPRARAIIKLAVVLFAILLQGAFHFFVWCLIFTALMGIFNRGLFKAAATVILIALLLSAVRLLPAAMHYCTDDRPRATDTYVTSRNLFDALTIVKPPTPLKDADFIRGFEAPPKFPTIWWDADVFIGLVGLLFILYYGVFLRAKAKPELDAVRFGELDLPLVFMSLFAVSYFYGLFTHSGFPFARAEIALTRFIIIPLVFLFVISAVRLDKAALSVNATLKTKLLVSAGLIAAASELMFHSWVWRIDANEKTPDYAGRVLDYAVKIIDKADPGYAAGFYFGLGITILTAAGLVYFYLRRVRKTA